MKRASAQTQSFASDMMRVGKIVGAFAAISLGKDAITGLIGMVKAEMKTIDATAKLSDRINTATEDLVALRHAAGLSGASADQMDKALETLSRRLGEVRMGTGEAKDGLKALGLSADQLAGMDTGQAFFEIADKLKGVERQSDKAAIAYKLFGRQGQQLLNTLDMGRDGLEAMREEVDRLGISFSRTDARQVEMANDALMRLQESARGLATKLAIEVAPFLTAIANELTDIGTEGDKASTIVTAGVDVMIGSAAALLDALQDVEKIWLQLQSGTTKGADLGLKGLVGFLDFNRKAMRKLAESADLPAPQGRGSLIESLQVLSDNMGEAAATAAAKLDKAMAAPKWSDALKETLTRIRAEAAKLADDLGKTAGDESQVNANVQKLVASLTEQEMALKLNAREYQRYKLEQMDATDAEIAQALAIFDNIEAMKSLNALMDEGAKLTESMRDPSEKFAATAKNLDRLLANNAISMDTYNRAIAKATDELNAAYEAQRQLARGSEVDLFSALDLSADNAVNLSNVVSPTVSNINKQEIIVEGQDETNDILSKIDQRLQRGLPMVLTT